MVRVQAGRADFHRLPPADRACDLIVAAFCLYHPPGPASVIARHTDRSRRARNARSQLEALGYDVTMTLRENAA